MQSNITMKRGKECKGSVRFETDDEKAPISNVYVSRAVPGVNEAQEITLTLAVGQSAAAQAKTVVPV